jgi:epoxyqueuosine reductase
MAEKYFHGEMKYMENHFDKRLDPRLLVEGSKSVISLSYNYFPEEKISALENLKFQNMLMRKTIMK